MRRIGKSWWMAAIAACGTALPAPLLAQEKLAVKKPVEAQGQPAAQTAKPNGSKVRDVALSEDGTFAGRVIDDHGKPLDGVVVKLVKADKEVGTTTADAQGRFKFASLKGGVYQVQTPQSQATYRLWQHDVAPNQAMKTVVMTASAPVVRGQLGFVDPATLAALGLGVAGVTLAGIAVHKLDKLEDDVDKIPTSP
ncbi:MAG TPA: carboxypeptidase-like regulatory domain-containing protein [Caulifigura sp.]|nr:carboxypeptidase-like regulatory domain-containing protein [Caulifigura sp.]